MCANYKNLDRKALFELFIQYKTLLKICISLNRSVALVHRGIDCTTFHKGVPEMSTEDENLAHKLFKVLNLRGDGYMSWEEYFTGMLSIKSKDISDKIDMFFKVIILILTLIFIILYSLFIFIKIIDADGNGSLSYDEVFDLSIISLKRTLKSEESSDIVIELAEYFSKLIFKLVNVDKDVEIELPLIKEVRFLYLFL